jgi:hypothetical protein
LGQEHPFVLVGHSFGGIVIESLVIEIYRISRQQHHNNLGKRNVGNANAFLKNMAGVAFYAIPHVGSRQLIEYICRQCEINFHSKQLAKAIILENIDSSISKGMIMEYGPTQIPRQTSYRVEGCDHFNVCKPPDQDHPSYDMLLQFLEGCRKVMIVVQLTNIGD